MTSIAYTTGDPVALAAALLVVLLVRLPTPGWPPDGWVLVMCDVGQGDALVLNAGSHQAVVVDTGPDPALVDHCLDRLGVQRSGLRRDEEDRGGRRGEPRAMHGGAHAVYLQPQPPLCTP